MALNWQLDAIPDHETMCWGEDKSMNPVTNALIWYTAIVGIQDTAKEADEFVWRVQFFEQLNGPMLWNEDGGHLLSSAEIRQHIGLRTNASPVTRPKFVRGVAENHRAGTLKKENS